MPRLLTYIYWDSCVFVDYINGEPTRLPEIDAVLKEVGRDDSRQILTSSVAKVEVAYGSEERTNEALDLAVEANIDALWQDSSVIGIVDFHDEIARMARDLIRYGVSQRWSLKPMDAIHLASAQWVGGLVNVTEIHTYDGEWDKFEPSVGCRICRPHVVQPQLPNMMDP